MNQTQTALFRRIGSSVFSTPVFPRNPKERKRFLLKNFILHFRPLSVPGPTIKFTLSWGLGGMAVVLVVSQIITGILLKFVYEPFPSQAYLSILHLQKEVPFGHLIRNMHYWSANLLVGIAFLHMCRVFFTGAFHAPRQFNWIIGLCLFLLILAANFTGYLLPWDQLSYWATTISIGMLEYIPVVGSWLRRTAMGGPEIGQASLKLFFAFHTTVIPFVLLLLMGFHFWRVRKAGGLVVLNSQDQLSASTPSRVDSFPHLLLRELVVALVLLASLLMISLLLAAPLAEPSNPGLSPNPTKAPWYFGGLQELLMHFHPTFAVFVIPLLFICAAVILPYVNSIERPRPAWFITKKGRSLAGIAALVGLIGTPLAVVLDEFIIHFEVWMPGISTVISNGIIPTGVLICIIVCFYALLVRTFLASRIEAVQAVFVLVIASFVVQTVICAFFRGEGMRLIWPF
jgi:quinol-cytochrome oxidoreductase complex cytochrome b subunit